MRLFEISKFFVPRAEADLPQEEEWLTGVMYRGWKQGAWNTSLDRSIFDLKGVVENLLEGFRVPDVGLFHGWPARIPALWRPGVFREPGVGSPGGAPAGHRRAAESGGRHLRVQSQFRRPGPGLPPPVLHALAPLSGGLPGHRPGVAGKRARRPGGRGPSCAWPAPVGGRGLFDVYVGDPVPPGKRSLAFRLSYRDPERTLTDDLVNSHHQAMVAALEKDLGAELR